MADEDLTGMENLLLVASLREVPKAEARRRAAELPELVQLKGAADQTVDTYSGGMRRRLELACGLINRPKVLFLDEPTLGLDVQTRTAVWNYIRLLKEKYHMTLLLTKHYLEEADNLCDRIAIIDHGKIVALDTPSTLKDSLGGDIRGDPRRPAAGGRSRRLAAGDPPVKEVLPVNGYRLTVVNGDETAPLVPDAIRAQDLKATKISIAKPTLDEVYLARPGRTMREQEGSREEVFLQRMAMRRARP